MSVTPFNPKLAPPMQARSMTRERMQQEYNFHLAQQMTKHLLDQGLITVDEFDKISARNRESFQPYLADIMG